MMYTQATAIQIGFAVSVLSCVVLPLIVWQWPWFWILVFDMLVLTSIVTANWGDWSTIAWMSAIVAAVNIAMAIVYAYMVRYAMTLYCGLNNSIACYVAVQYIVRTDLPIYRRLDAFWCSCTKECGILIGGIGTFFLVFLAYNIIVQRMMNKYGKSIKNNSENERARRVAMSAIDERFDEMENKYKQKRKRESRTRRALHARRQVSQTRTRTQTQTRSTGNPLYVALHIDTDTDADSAPDQASTSSVSGSGSSSEHTPSESENDTTNNDKSYMSRQFDEYALHGSYDD